MYYRYKRKKKDTKIFKTLFILALITVCGYFIYTYRSHLMIWKYSHNKLIKKIETANNIPDIIQRREALRKLLGPFKSYREENITKPDAFILTGSVYYLIGSTQLQGYFSDLVIKNVVHSIPQQAKDEFMQAIKYFKKGEALLRSESLEPRHAIQLAKALFYCNYESPENIYNLMHTYEDALNNKERIRFYSFICILHNQADKGISLLKSGGGIDKDIQGKMFFAITEKYARHYTNSIKLLKDIVQQTQDKIYLKIAHVNLGEIFFNQSLHAEALFHYSALLSLDDTYNDARIIMGKIYLAQGDKAKAKATWEDALKWDKQNKEIEKLLASVKR